MKDVREKIKKNAYIILGATAIIGTILFLWAYPRYFCAGSISIQMSKDQALVRAETLLKEMGYPTPQGQPTVTIHCDEETAGQLNQLLGSSLAGDLRTVETPVFFWKISWALGPPAPGFERPFQTGQLISAAQPQEYLLALDNSGSLREFFVSGRVFRGQGMRFQESGGDDGAERLARDFLGQFTGYVIPDSVKPVIEGHQGRPVERRQVIWTLPVANSSLEKRVVVDVLAQRVVGFKETLLFPEQETMQLPELRPGFQYIKYSVPLVLLFLILWNLYRHIRYGHADFHRAFWLGLLITTGLMVSEVLHQLLSGNPSAFEPLRYLLAIVIGLSIAMIYLAAEPMVRSRCLEKLRSIDLVLSGVLFHRQVGRSILIGFAVGLGLLGLVSATLLLAEFFSFPLVLHIHDLSKILNVKPPFLALLRGLFWRVPMLILVFFMFVPAYLTIRKDRPWRIVFLSALVYAAAWFPLFDFHPIWFQFLFAFVTGMVITRLFLTEGLLAVDVAVAVVFIALRLPPLLSASVPEFLLSGLLALLILGFLLSLAFLAVWRKRDAIVNKKHYVPVYLRRISEEAKLKKEMEIAREIQHTLQPREVAPVDSLRFSSLFVPCQEVGGDAFDFIPLANGSYAAVVLDVSGHGVAAALIASHLQAQIRVMLRYEQVPEVLLAELNEYMYYETPNYLFATMFLLIGDANGHFTYASAGHNPAFLMRKERQIEQLTGTGILLGAAPDKKYEKVMKRLYPGESLLIYTDGITEAMNSENQEFGEQRLRDFLKDNGLEHDFIKQLEGEVLRFSDDKLSDDITAFFIKHR